MATRRSLRVEIAKTAPTPRERRLAARSAAILLQHLKIQPIPARRQRVFTPQPNQEQSPNRENADDRQADENTFAIDDGETTDQYIDEDEEEWVNDENGEIDADPDRDLGDEDLNAETDWDKKIYERMDDEDDNNEGNDDRQNSSGDNDEGESDEDDDENEEDDEDNNDDD